MRHLKTYQLFENSSELISDIKDILLDLSDNGMDVYVTTRNLNLFTHLVVIVSTFESTVKGFTWENISDNFIRAKEYIEKNSDFKLSTTEIGFVRNNSLCGKKFSLEKKDQNIIKDLLVYMKLNKIEEIIEITFRFKSSQ